MKMKMLSVLAAVAAVSGCMTCSKCTDPVVGNWGLKLGYGSMNAGHMIVSRNAEGKAEAIVLWRWASPIPMKSCVIEGNSFTIDHPWGFVIKGTVEGDKLTATAMKGDKLETTVVGWKNPEIKCANTADAKLGEPIDILKDGIDGFKKMDEKAYMGWSFKDGVLSNRVPKGQHGVNIMTKRADFYDFNLEYDVCVPKGANSGVYLRGRYEIQTVDSFGKAVDCHNMAAYYGRVTPSVAAEKPAGEWQHVSVTLYKRHLTVVLNGKKIIDNVPVVGVTGGAIDANEFVAGPLYIQGDHSDADYKNMILRPVLN